MALKYLKLILNVYVSLNTDKLLQSEMNETQLHVVYIEL